MKIVCLFSDREKELLELIERKKPLAENVNNFSGWKDSKELKELLRNKLIEYFLAPGNGNRRLRLTEWGEEIFLQMKNAI